ncbi:General secretion pathway protein G [hydrothermal vent metagenome]|uniref:Type II secretion system core protein G n=1 Tax=hydrothermal vent metagenome TaxID=652676 RepID=A0A3B1AZL6_9ZZZZ
MNLYRKLTTQKPTTRQSGFTLIEIMVVIVILGILAAVVVPNIMSRPDEARVSKAKQDIRALSTALDLYKLDNYAYPTTDQGIEALATKPTSAPEPKHFREEGYLKKVPLDPWQNPYQYLSPGEHGSVDIYSLGPDQTPSDDDIGDWNLE